MNKIATVADVIASARYDLRDFGGQKFDDDQMVNYVNRVIPLLDRLLIKQNSDFTMTVGTNTLSSGEYTSTAPTRSELIVSMFNSTEEIYKESLKSVLYRYQMNNESSITGPPNYWAYNNNSLVFDIEADANYTLDVHYHVNTTTLTTSGNMPYNDWFNDVIVQAIVIMATKAKEDKIVNPDMQFYELFKREVNSAVVGRNHVPKRKHLGF